MGQTLQLKRSWSISEMTIITDPAQLATIPLSADELARAQLRRSLALQLDSCERHLASLMKRLRRGAELRHGGQRTAFSLDLEATRTRQDNLRKMLRDVETNPRS